MKVTLNCPKCHFENPESTKYCGKCATPLPISDDTLEAQTETLVVPIVDMKTGSILADRYEIIEELGKGGMGKVYKALDREISEKIAVKIIRPEIATNKKIIERFHNELKMARTITHKNVCRMHDLGRDGKTRFITMEYVSGEDLKKSIRRMGPLTVRKAISIGKQICHGLSEAHSLGVFHRDLKPHNIMIDREGNAKIMDFGIALSQKARGITDSNVIIGTPQYLSPEQVEGKKVDQRSDIYSLGVILFEMVTGQVPFDGDTTLSVAVKHKTEIPRDPKEFNAQIPEELSQLILRCLEKNPEQRYQSVDELYSMLTEIEGEMPTTETVITRRESRLSHFSKNLILSRLFRTIFICALICIAGYFIYNQFKQRESDDNLQTSIIDWKSSVIVLPFKNLGSTSDQKPFDLVLTNMLISSLHGFREIRVQSLRTAQAYQNSKKDVQTIGREINVTHVLEGTILETEDTLQVNVQLSNVEDGSLIWSDSLERPSENNVDFHEEIIKAVARALGIQRVEEKYSQIKGGESNYLMANRHYRNGLQFEVSYYYSGNEEDFNKCVHYYSQVVDLSPNDAQTYWRLGNIHEARFNNEIIFENREKYLDLMLGYYQSAYDIDPNFAEPNVGLGWSYFYKKDNDKAYQFFKRACEIDPNNAEIHFHTGSFLRSIGLYQQALNHYSLGLEIDPNPLEFKLWYHLRALTFGYLGRFEEAIASLRIPLEKEPNFIFYINCSLQLIMLKKYGEAETMLNEAEEYASDLRSLIRLKQTRALLFAAKGEKETSLELIKDETITYRDIITSIYSLLGMKDEAVRNIQIGIDVGFEKHLTYFYSYPYLQSNPCYNNLRDDQRFQQIRKIEKVKYDEKIKKYGDL
jgi:serine/threonine protein kinase